MTSSKGKQSGKRGQHRMTNMSKVKYYKWGQPGHYANSPECPEYTENKSKDSDSDDLGDKDEGVQQFNVEINSDHFL